MRPTNSGFESLEQMPTLDILYLWKPRSDPADRSSGLRGG